MIDSHAWVEYLRGSPAGRSARKYIESQSAATSVITLTELRSKYSREGWKTFEEDVNFISTKTALIFVDTPIALSAGQIHHERRKIVKDWGLADSIVLATARATSGKVVTGDPHFQGLSQAIILKP